MAVERLLQQQLSGERVAPLLSARRRDPGLAQSMVGLAAGECLVDGLHRNACAFADGIRTIEGAEVLNDVVYTQVSVSFGSDERW